VTADHLRQTRAAAQFIHKMLRQSHGDTRLVAEA